MKLIFAGTPDFAVPTLQALLDSKHEILAVYTQPDRPAGRGRQLRASPVKVLAESHNIQVLQPTSFKEQKSLDQLEALQPELMVVVAYGLILPREVLAIPTHGCLNVHASLLPRWRGAAPIQRAILTGDEETGVTIMQMDEGLDTGGMLKLASIPINPGASAQDLHDELSKLGADCLLSVVDAIEQGNPPVPVKQNDNDATYAAKFSKSEAEIDWTQSAVEVLRQVNAFNPWPVAFTRLSGKTLRVWQASEVSCEHNATAGELLDIDDGCPVIACGQQALKLLELQPEGKKRMPASAFMNSRKADLPTGSIIGQ